jgi:hypothetical protein
MTKLYYEAELGDNISIDYFKSKEALITEKDRLNNPLK